MNRKTIIVAAVAALVVGFYDGFYGPGTGTFLIIAFTVFAHIEGPEYANAQAKVINVTTNMTALTNISYKRQSPDRFRRRRGSLQHSGELCRKRPGHKERGCHSTPGDHRSIDLTGFESTGSILGSSRNLLSKTKINRALSVPQMNVSKDIQLRKSP